MNENNEIEEKIKGSLDHWKGQTILVEKEELNNTDQAYLHLTDVRIKTINKNTDDYLANRSLELIGGGETVEEVEGPLPYSSYDIPLTQLSAIQSGDKLLKFQNDRATYTVHPL